MNKMEKKGTVIKYALLITILIAFSLLLMAGKAPPSCICGPV
jgi:hypothetical protein